MIPWAVALVGLLVMLILSIVVPMLVYGIVRLVSAAAGRMTGAAAARSGLPGLWGEVVIGAVVCAVVAAAVFLLGSEVPHANAIAWTALITGPACVRVLRAAFANAAASVGRKFVATAVALATFAATFASLRTPLPLWQRVQYPNCVLDVRIDASGRVTGIHGNATACFGIDFTSTAFATLDVVAVEEDGLVYRDLLLTFGREHVDIVPPRGRALYGQLIVEPMRQRMEVMKKLG